MILITEPHIPTPQEESEKAVYDMKVNIHRMEYMMSKNYYVNKYTDEEWEKFKIINNERTK